MTVALGFAGLAGVVARLDRALILHLILAIVACLLSLTYADKVDEGVAIDCAFAETFIRLGNLGERDVESDVERSSALPFH